MMESSSASVLDAPVAVSKQMPKMAKSGTMPPLRDPSFLYAALGGHGQRSVFLPAEYDLSELGRIADTESLVTQASLKKIGLMFKEGFEFTGNNPQTVTYIKARLRQIAQTSSVSTDELLRAFGRSLVDKSNFFALKIRKVEASGGKVRKIPGTTRALDPVAAYFTVPAETVQVKLDASGHRVVQWLHYLSDSYQLPILPDNMVHGYYNRKDGFIFGTPTLIPVIDDIRALRKIEENVELLVYQHLFPLFHYQIGTEDSPAGITENGEDEIEVARHQIRMMPAEGGIITPERHSIKLLGTEGRALRAEAYLDYFKKRVIAGLGISSIDLGDGETSNRATSDTMSRNLVDSVKDLQQVLENIIDEEIIKELLLESDFGDLDVLDEDNIVHVKFNEIDMASKIKKDAHLIDSFAKNAITHDEMRVGMGLKTIPVPTRDEAQSGEDLSDKYPEWNKLFWKLFDEPKLLIQALDEPWSAEARAAAASASTSINTPDLNAATKTAEQQKQNEQTLAQKTALKVAKVRQVGKVKNFQDLEIASKKPTISIVRKRFDEAENVVTAALRLEQRDASWLGAKVRAVLNPAKENLAAQMASSFFQGYRTINRSNKQYAAALAKVRPALRNRSEAYVQRLQEDLARQIGSYLKSIKDQTVASDEVLLSTRAIFDALRYRANAIDDNELHNALILGKVAALKDVGSAKVEIVGGANPCEACLRHIGKVFAVDSEDVPPFHPHCQCDIIGI
jgi:hypothetical protein